MGSGSGSGAGVIVLLCVGRNVEVGGVVLLVAEDGVSFKGESP